MRATRLTTKTKPSRTGAAKSAADVRVTVELEPTACTPARAAAIAAVMAEAEPAAKLLAADPVGTTPGVEARGSTPTPTGPAADPPATADPASIIATSVYASAPVAAGSDLRSTEAAAPAPAAEPDEFDDCSLKVGVGQ